MTFEECYELVFAHRRTMTAGGALHDTDIVLCACGLRFWNEKSHSKHVAECLVDEMQKGKP